MAWVSISKPNTSNWTNTAKPTGYASFGVGYYVGSLGLTYSDQITFTNWIDVSKPTTNNWVNISKPT